MIKNCVSTRGIARTTDLAKGGARRRLLISNTTWIFFGRFILNYSLTILAVFSPFWSRPQAKALTIGKLMEIAPAGTVDPTPFIYDSTMYTMAGLMVRPCRVLPASRSCCDVGEGASTRQAALLLSSTGCRCLHHLS